MSPDRPPDPIAVAVDFCGRLERLDVPYVVAGSFASSIHGEPRSTNDVDIVAELTGATIGPLLEGLGADYYADPEAARAAVRSGASFNAIHLPTAVKVDVFVAGGDAFDEERLSLRERVRVWSDPPHELYVDTAEHTVLRKLEWFRRGGEVSERQWGDVLGILRAHGARLDRGRLELWASRLGVTDLLRRAEAEAARA